MFDKMDTFAIDPYLEKSTVLYVEDEDVIRESVARFLKRRIIHLYTASNGKEGLQMFKDFNSDIIITDIRMPKMNGLEMASAIKEINDDVPIIITTAYNDEEFFLKAIDIGIDKYIKKPINNKDLLTILHKLAKHITQQKEILAKNDFIRIIMDSNPSFLMITDGQEIDFLNKPFLNFLGYDEIDEFKHRCCTINKFLVVKEGAFYNDRPFHDWIEDVLKQDNNNNCCIIHMTGKDGLRSQAHSYIVRATEIPEIQDRGRYLVTFTDVSNIEYERQILHELSIKDPLTNVYNRKKFNDEVQKEIERSIRYNNKLSLIFFDIDHFKKINDTCGHQLGDYVLQELTKVASENLRKVDVLARYGGEEFVVLTPGIALEGAKETAEKIRQKIETHRFNNVGKVTCSFGVTEYMPKEDACSFIKKADYALYISKNKGRNMVSAVGKEHSIMFNLPNCL
ncbi:response regulator receiver modulated diguanylate cyclase [Candidatus Magnetoovum chiemensis]|nr:response regulator receiver modulated diguanylate cyclase [Candidatus Magnetoovum chiemensis]